MREKKKIEESEYETDGLLDFSKVSVEPDADDVAVSDTPDLLKPQDDIPGKFVDLDKSDIPEVQSYR